MYGNEGNYVNFQWEMLNQGFWCELQIIVVERTNGWLASNCSLRLMRGHTGGCTRLFRSLGELLVVLLDQVVRTFVCLNLRT